MTTMSNSSLKVLILANSFYPSIGGYEGFCRFLAEGLATRFDVSVVTDTAAATEPAQRNFRIFRAPTSTEMHQIVKEANLIILNSVSLKYVGVVISALSRVIVIHHSGYKEYSSWRNLVLEQVKRLICIGFRLNICVSQYVASRIPGRKIVIHNSYDDSLFFDEERVRPKSILFVGRLVTEKGARMLLGALQRIRTQAVDWTLTVIGDGPERGILEDFVSLAGLTDAVTFLGWLQHEAVANEMKTHSILAIPSLHEPFGIVALEGLACGCKVVHSDCEGLKEACGGFGIAFKAGDERELAEGLLKAIALTEDRIIKGQPELVEFLIKHSNQRVLNKYLEVISGLSGLAHRSTH
jgi:glycogen synthase